MWYILIDFDFKNFIVSICSVVEFLIVISFFKSVNGKTNAAINIIIIIIITLRPTKYCTSKTRIFQWRQKHRQSPRSQDRNNHQHYWMIGDLHASPLMSPIYCITYTLVLYKKYLQSRNRQWSCWPFLGVSSRCWKNEKDANFFNFSSMTKKWQKASSFLFCCF